MSCDPSGAPVFAGCGVWEDSVYPTSSDSLHLPGQEGGVRNSPRTRDRNCLSGATRISLREILYTFVLMYVEHRRGIERCGVM